MMTITATTRRGEDVPSGQGQILALLRDGGPMPRIELSRRSGLSPTSITRLINQLQGRGLVAEGDLVSPTRPGRPATDVRLVADAVFAIGVQIGVGFAQIGVLDALGRVVALEDASYPADDDAETVLSMIATRLERLVASVPAVAANRILGIGIAAPGAVDDTRRRVIRPINLTWRDIPLAEMLEALVNRPVIVQHNVSSMALAESLFGSGRGLDRVAYVYLRTGLGAGLAVSGHSPAGIQGAVEIGHLRTDSGNLVCTCGGRGCLETVVSDSTLRASCVELGITVGGRSPLAALVDERDRPEVAARLEHITDQLATGISSLGTLLNPEIILLGGALGELPDDFLDLLIERTRHSIFLLLRDGIRIERSSLGTRAGAIGAGTVALEAFLYT